MRDQIIKKIKALLNKTIENGATKEEAELALQKANELMTKYMVQLNDLKEISKDDIVNIEVDIPRYRVNFNRVDNALSRLFGTENFITAKRNRIQSLIFFGLKHDVECCVYFHIYLTRCLFNDTLEFRKYLRKVNERGDKPIEVFQSSWISTLIIKIMEMKQQQSKPTGNSLVLYEKDKYIKSKLQEQFDLKPFTSEDNYNKFINDKAEAMGKSMAEKIDLRMGVGESCMEKLNNH